jgi:hypothetical protein
MDALNGDVRPRHSVLETTTAEVGSILRTATPSSSDAPLTSFCLVFVAQDHHHLYAITATLVQTHTGQARRRAIPRSLLEFRGTPLSLAP